MTHENTDGKQISDKEAIEVARAAVSAESQAIGRVAPQITDTLPQVIHLIHSRTGKVFVTGGGTSSAIARRMAHLLSVSGTPALFIHAMDALHGTMGAIAADDVLIAISKGGESDEINQLCQCVQGRGTAVIGIGERPQSTLATLSDIFVHLHTAEGGDPENVVAMGSTLVAAVWGDALARTLMYINAWTVEDSVAIHPAGYVGKMAEQIRMRDTKAGLPCEQ